METIRFRDALNNPKIRSVLVNHIKAGKVFVYPTDTIYGIGCNAEIEACVEKIRQAKGRPSDKNFSVIAPGKSWIWKVADLSKINMSFADSLLPGPYTIIVKARHGAPESVVSAEQKTIGIRLPKCDFAGLIAEAGVPFVTTSVNLSGGEPITKVSDIPESMRYAIDFCIDAGKISGLPSRVFDLTTDDIKIRRY